MSGHPSRSRATFVIVQALWGMILLIAPGKVLLLLGGADEDRVPKRVMRILGSRHVVQAIAEHIFGDAALRLGVWVDGLHALSGLGFACADARWRRAALTDVAITAGFAVVGLTELGMESTIAPT